MKMYKLAMLALIAVFAIGVVAAGASAATHPEFDTESGKTLAFTASGGTAQLFGERAGIVGEINCESSSGSGEILNKTPLADNILISFEGKCHETISGSTSACTEPITTKRIRGEIGLILPATSPKTVGILLIPYNSTGEFAEPVCNGTGTKVTGAIIGTFPETTKYNKLEKTAEIAFTSSGITQAQTEIDLLGVEMKGIHLHTAGLFGGNAAENAEAIITGDGGINILSNN